MLSFTSLCYGRWPYLPPGTEEVAPKDHGHIQMVVGLEMGRGVGACTGIMRAGTVHGVPESDL